MLNCNELIMHLQLSLNRRRDTQRMKLSDTCRRKKQDLLTTTTMMLVNPAAACSIENWQKQRTIPRVSFPFMSRLLSEGSWQFNKCRKKWGIDSLQRNLTTSPKPQTLTIQRLWNMLCNFRKKITSGAWRWCSGSQRLSCKKMLTTNLWEDYRTISSRVLRHERQTYL